MVTITITTFLVAFAVKFDSTSNFVISEFVIQFEHSLSIRYHIETCLGQFH